jgi:hypothetical protein
MNNDGVFRGNNVSVLKLKAGDQPHADECERLSEAFFAETERGFR